VTSVWLVQIGSKVYQKLGNGYNFFTFMKIFHSTSMVWARRPFEDWARISSYSNDVTSVWLFQMGSKVNQKLGNGYIFLLL
jgi:hypothetical protein